MVFEKHGEISVELKEAVIASINKLNENGITVTKCILYDKWAKFEFINLAGYIDKFIIYHYPYEQKFTIDICVTRHDQSARRIHYLLWFDYEDYYDDYAACYTYCPKWQN